MMMLMMMMMTFWQIYRLEGSRGLQGDVQWRYVYGFEANLEDLLSLLNSNFELFQRECSPHPPFIGPLLRFPIHTRRVARPDGRVFLAISHRSAHSLTLYTKEDYSEEKKYFLSEIMSYLGHRTHPLMAIGQLSKRGKFSLDKVKLVIHIHKMP